jgi:hypothetical protein
MVMTRSERARRYALERAQVFTFLPQRVDDVSEFDGTKERERRPSDVDIVPARAGVCSRSTSGWTGEGVGAGGRLGLASVF